jgi:hypothetical protein
MAAGAFFRAGMRFGAANWTGFLPRGLHGLFDFRFRRSRGAKPRHAWLVGLLDGALGVDPARRIDGRTADGANTARRLANDD